LGLYRHKPQPSCSVHRRYNSLSRRIWEHRKEIGAAFAATYRCNKLIYYEHYSDADEAFARETQLKKWSRAKKIALIDRLNPSWLDLRDHLLEDGEQ